MKAITQSRYGGPDVLVLSEVDKPVPAASQILVRVEASVATLPDCAFRRADPFIARAFTGLLRPRYPIPGSCFAGSVEAVGSAVRRFRPGDGVFGENAAFGAYAEYLCVEENQAVTTRPAAFGPGEAAGLAYGFLTAMPFLRDEAQLKPGQSILINGASGSIGLVALQLARLMGARVTGVASARNLALLRALGADAVIDYGQQDFTADSDRYDVIFDAVGKSSFAACRRALAATGIYLTTVPSLGILRDMLATRSGSGRRARLATTGLRATADRKADLDLLVEMVGQGRLRAVIDRRYPLDQVAAAHAYVETERKVGDVVIDIAPPALPAPA